MHDLIQATIAGQYRTPRITARILQRADLLPHETVLAGQYGTFLAPDMLAWPAHGSIRGPAIVCANVGVTVCWPSAEVVRLIRALIAAAA